MSDPPPKGFAHPRQRAMHRDFSRHGGRARAAKLTPAERQEIARAGGKAKAAKRREKDDGRG